MELHNTVEDTVIFRVTEILDSIEKSGNPEQLCTCNQCRMDTVCFVLNRTKPHYIVSNRGVARADQQNAQKRQEEVDIVSLAYEGIRRVNHNLRPNADHRSKGSEKGLAEQQPVYNIPTIIGRIFDGRNFAPISDARVELYHNGELVIMKDSNWQNPYSMVSNTEGTFTFWPNPVPAEQSNEHRVFEFNVRVESSEYETLNHFFKIPVISDTQAALAYSTARTVKLPDLYLFPPGSDEDEELL
jgi:competence protein ComFB